MKHILERHHPKYWNGTTKKAQTFFNANMSLNDVRSLVHAAMKQKTSTLRSQGTNATFTVSGRVDGVNYTMRISKGRVVQFYPR
ncbi:EndoU domain-containing protein [Micrococcus luteus]|uniref:EndoU domain-containing protein n=1 Tax=Micrococcus luteus TaxID=1270 RepID=UPI0036C79662